MRFPFSLVSALSALAFAAGAVACSGSASSITPVVVNGGSTLTFTPTKLVATRRPGACGVANPAYANGDYFELEVMGAGAGDPSGLAVTTIDVDFPVPLPAAPSALVLTPASQSAPGAPYIQQNATTPDNSVDFSFAWGTNANEIDPSALHRVDVTILAIPQRDGDPLTVRTVIQFDDGKTLDETFSAPVSSESVQGCPMG